ncbi:hepcidin-1 [Narcine bancroftii]|uniref:hepcidin-1 n=1 Tax=Narcine bancroftii TaxID=1343680 RepID=UPI0038310599
MSSWKMRLLLVGLVLATLVALSECRSLLEVKEEQSSLSVVNSEASHVMGPAMTRFRRTSHLSICLYCCTCCKSQRGKCGYCCRM